MVGLYIASTSPRAGKSLLSFSLGVLLQRRGLRVGYMKPLGAIPQHVDERMGDADALVVQEVLGQQADADTLTPVMIPDTLRALPLFDAGERSESLERIVAAYGRLAVDKDMMLVSGTGAFPATGRFCGADGLTVARRLGLKVLLVERFDGHIDYDALLHVRDLLGEDLLGVVLNDVPPEDMRDARDVLVPYLSRRGTPVRGIVPRESGLWAIRVTDLAYGLSGCIVAGNAQASRMVEGFLIGTMQVENFMPYLRRHPGCAVIAGGDRADLQLAALFEGCICLILTGNITPGELVRSRAESRGVPVICVREDTYTVACSMARILKDKKLRGLSQIRLAMDLAGASLDLDAILAAAHGG